MNILHMKYAVEVARLGSLTRAADELLIAQPNISRSIKELEADLGITIFVRSTKGMTLTREGAEFIRMAEGILRQIDDVESVYKRGAARRQHLCINAPHSFYISSALCEISAAVGDTELSYRETDADTTLASLIDRSCDIGIIRFASNRGGEIADMLSKRGLRGEIIAELPSCIIVGSDNPLAAYEVIDSEHLGDMTEIVIRDELIPTSARTSEPRHSGGRSITVSDRACAIELLTRRRDTYMITVEPPQLPLDRFDIIARPLSDNMSTYTDLLVTAADCKRTRLDKQFIAALHTAAASKR